VADVDAEREVEAEHRQHDAVAPVGLLEDAVRHVGVEPLVEPRLLELVARDHPVEELVPGLVDRHSLGPLHARRGAPLRAGRDQRRVLHAARAVAAPRRVHDRQRRVRVRAEHAAVARKRGLRGAEVALRLRRVLRLQQQDERGVSDPRLAEGVAVDEEGRVRGPREVVDALLLEAVEDAPHRRLALLGLRAGRADLPLSEDGTSIDTS
jgi:hypothetical protein